MATSSHSPSASSPVELEPVTCWPLIIGAGSFVVAVVVLVGGFAAWSALHPPPQSTAFIEVAAEPEAVPIQEEPVDLPAAPVVRNENDRVVKVHREVIERRYTPLPQARKRASDPTPPTGNITAPPVPVPPTYRALTQSPENPWLQGLRKEETDRKPLGFRPADDLGAIRMKKLGEEQLSLTQTIRDLLTSHSDSADRPGQNEKD